MLDVTGDSPELTELKRQIYHLSYMDNCAVSADSVDKIMWAYKQLQNIFNAYGFQIQQVYTNAKDIQDTINHDFNQDNTEEGVKLFGLVWNRKEDTLSIQKLFLNEDAVTKREILSSIASNFDIFNFNGPLLNRARLFLHELQCRSELSWDAKLSEMYLKNWKNIVKQVNAAPQINIDRFVGGMKDKYKLVAFTDSSKQMFGVVIYIVNLSKNTTSFLLAKNRIVNRKLEDKSIPSLELLAISLGTEVMMDTVKELSGEECVNPINIEALEVYTDSMVCLNWLNLYVNKMDKMQNKSVFVMNRLAQVSKLCESNMPVKYLFCNGVSNPADFMTRPFSYKQLIRGNFFSGPIVNDSIDCDITVTIPHPVIHEIKSKVELNVNYAETCTLTMNKENCSTFTKCLRVSVFVLKFINILKNRLIQKRNDRSFSCFGRDSEIEVRALNVLLESDQREHYPEIVQWFESNSKSKTQMPDVVCQLNIFKDIDGLLKVKSKFGRFVKNEFPILLHRDSQLSRKLVVHYHEKLNHVGIYQLLNELRVKFWIPKVFSFVRSVLKECMKCKKLHKRTIKLNQSSYRDFRADPKQIPFRQVFVDHIGPFQVRNSKECKVKVYLLCITCLWSRAINLKVCNDLSLPEFLKGFQLHTFEYGVPESCISDMGSQIVAGSKIITEFLSRVETRKLFGELGIQPTQFSQFDKGKKELGSIVESAVKLVKRLIQCSIDKILLNKSEFYFTVSQCLNVVNRRPIAFQESLRENDPTEDIPRPITPQMLVNGRELPTVNLIPQLQQTLVDPDWRVESDKRSLSEDFEKLCKVGSNLVRIYNEEFYSTLLKQATDRKGRYKPVTHDILGIGDVVLIKEEFAKQVNYPLAIVKEITKNYLNEVTGATLMKGCNREVIRRHVSQIIPVLSQSEGKTEEELGTIKGNVEDYSKTKESRAAALKCREKCKEICNSGLV